MCNRLDTISDGQLLVRQYRDLRDMLMRDKSYFKKFLDPHCGLNQIDNF